MSTPGALDGVTVLDLGATVAAQMCAAILANAGAAVTRVAPGGGDPLAGQVDAEDWQAYLDLDKAVDPLDPAAPGDRGRLEGLLGAADVLLTSEPPERLAALGLDAGALAERHPHLLCASVTPFGDDGPYANLAADDVVLAALAGLADATPGFPDRRESFGDPPLQSRAPLAEVGGAILAAVAVLGALLPRLEGRPGPQRVEVSVLEAVVAQMVYEWGICAFGGGVRGRRPVPADLEPNCYLPCRDGHVVLVAFTPSHWRGLCAVMGDPRWAQAPEFADAVSRAAHAEALHRHLRAWAAEQDGPDVLAAAQALGVPCCCVLELSETLASEQVRNTGALREHRGRSFPADPIVVDGRRRTTGAPNPVSTRAHAPRIDGAAPAAGPLAGLRVLDLTQVVAGPFCGMLLRALGADVVLVESRSRLLSRGFGPFVGSPAWDGSMMFNNVNRGKRSVALDLAAPGSRDVLEELVANADVVIENFSLRAARALGLTYDDLRAIREDVILASISAFGRTGPWGGFIALHSGVIGLSGLASVTRDDRGEPRLAGAIYPDLLAGAYMAVAVQQAVARRRRDGTGGHVELSMLDVLLSSMGGLVPGAAEGATTEPHPARFLPTAEPGRFVAVSGGGEDAVEEAAVAGATRRAATARLQAEGVRAGAVLDVGEAMVDPHLIARGFVVADDHPVSGPRIMAGVPWRVDGARPRLGRAPCLGEHTDEVLAELTGRSREEVERLRVRGALS